MTWETVPLGEVANYVRGITYQPADVVSADDGGVPCLRTKNIQAVLDLSNLVHVRADLRHRPEQRVRPNDVLVSSANSWHLVGRAVQARADASDMLIGGFIGAIRFDSTRVDPHFGFRWFSSPQVQSVVRGFGQQTTNIANLNVERTLRLSFPLPPLPEQRRIAAILDEADALRAKSGQAIGLMRDARAALFRDAQRDDLQEQVLGEIADLYGGASLPVGQPFTGQQGGYLLIKVSDMNRAGNEVSMSHANEWSPEPGARAATAPEGSVVLPKRGAAIATNKKRLLRRAAVLDPNLMAIRGHDGVLHPDWLHGWFESFDLASVQSGSSVPQLNKQDLVPLRISVPSWAGQLAFAERTQELHVQAGHLRARGNILETLFASLQHRAFRGEL